MIGSFRRVCVSAVVALALMAMLLPDAGAAQQASRTHRIGVIYVGGPSVEQLRAAPTTRALLQGLAEFGYVEGKNLIFEARPQADVERFDVVLDDLLRLRPDVFYAYVCGQSFHLLRKRVTTVPIVVGACNDDLVAKGIVASLARPGGNVTGQSKITPELAAKRLSLARELLPSTKRVAILWNPHYADFVADWQTIRAAAATLGIDLEAFAIHTASDLERAFPAMARWRPDVLVTFSDTVVHGAAKRVAELAATHRIPAIYAFREVPDAGGLISYGPNLNALYRESARYVARIFNGAHPGEIPIEQPTKFELVINLKTAKALGLTIPPSLLLRADQVLE